MTNISYIKCVGFIDNNLIYNLCDLYRLARTDFKVGYLEQDLKFTYVFPCSYPNFNFIRSDYGFKRVSSSKFVKSKQQYIREFCF